MPETRTLEEIEAEARRLCGDEFEVRVVANEPPFVQIGFNVSSQADFYPDRYSNVWMRAAGFEFASAARFIDICRKLDSYIRGET